MVAINDMVAYGVRDALLDTPERKIPEDISLCGFDNIYPSGFHGVELTTVEHSIVERGRSSIRLLAEKLRGQPGLAEDGNAVTRVEYQSRLVVRGFYWSCQYRGKHIAEQIGADKSSQGRKYGK